MGVSFSVAQLDEKSVEVIAERIENSFDKLSKTLFYIGVSACTAYTIVNIYRGPYKKPTKRIDLNHKGSILTKNGQLQGENQQAL
jgi:hypothetical protein